MTKKIKIILTSSSLILVTAIVPPAVISCSASTTTSDNTSSTTSATTTINNNVQALKNIPALSANANNNVTAIAAAALLPSGATDLNALSSYFNTSLITSAAISNGVSATYTAAVSTTSGAANTLAITVTMTLGTATATQIVDISGFLTNQVAINNSVQALKNIPALSAKENTDITANTAATLINNNPNNLSILNNYFNTSQIESIAQKSGATVTYSATVVTPPNTTTIATFAATSDTANTLVITVTMTLGTIIATQVINVSGFPNVEKAANFKILNNLSSTLSALPLIALSTQSGVTPSAIYSTLNSNTSLTLNALNSFFNTDSISTAINTANSTTNSITVIYATNPTTNDNANGTIGITITLSIGANTSLATENVNLTISGFSSTNQTVINNNVQALKSLTNLSAKANTNISAVNAAKLLSSGSTNLNSLSNYININPIVNAVTSNGVAVTYSAAVASTSAAANTLVITITMTLGSITTTQTIDITGWSLNNNSTNSGNTTNTGSAQQIATLITNAIPNKQSASVFTNNKPITFTLNTLPSWLNSITSSQISAALPTDVTISEVSITLSFPSLSTGSINNSGEISSELTVTIKSANNQSISSNTIYKFA